MTDKQIIIDGVDVSGCEWIREVGLDSEYICTCNSPNKTSGYCKHNPNCYYKQFKRLEKLFPDMNGRYYKAVDDLKAKEQECNELRIYIESNKQQVKEVETLVMDNDRLVNELNEAKIEIDALKKQLMQKNEVDMFFNTPLEGWSNDPCGVCKYKQTLIEVKEMLQTIIETNKIFPLFSNLSKIIQRIKSIEGESVKTN